MMASVDLMAWMKVHSTSMLVLHKILTAGHGSKPAGNWVVMTTKIAGVKLIAIAYAWTQKGVPYFISTCGNTKPSQ
jgi:hypothetical protein